MKYPGPQIKLGYVDGYQLARRFAHRLTIVTSVTGATLILAILLTAGHLPAQLSADLISAACTVWLHGAAPGLPCPAGRLNSRALRLWARGFGACYLPPAVVRLPQRAVLSGLFSMAS